jgi:hypothetical protein
MSHIVIPRLSDSAAQDRLNARVEAAVTAVRGFTDAGLFREIDRNMGKGKASDVLLVRAVLRNELERRFGVHVWREFVAERIADKVAGRRLTSARVFMRDRQRIG